MTDSEPQDPSGKTDFSRVPRRNDKQSAQAHRDRDRANLVDELQRIRRRLTTIIERGRDAFFDEEDETNYLAAQAVIINFADMASRRIPDSVKDQLPDVSWSGISAMRNLLAHDYRGIQKELVWRAATNDLPPLLEQLLADHVL